ncbi:hypothetical protein [Anaerosporobacter faecicola]|uniref:hypothetical protein n=1 Tax=Anaerosporobacter faecicola TaxID=2718714 RepID=UPI001438EC06|nr:hypothetical protein [Anaerosporobacter faecicola]
MNYQEAVNEILELKEEIRVMEYKAQEATKSYEERVKELNRYKAELNEEKMDVEQLENVSFSKILYKIAGKYEEKYQKEYQEYLTAKRKYDEYAIDIQQVKEALEHYRREINAKQLELQEKQANLRTIYKEGQELAQKEEEERKRLYRQKKELDEAIQATNRVLNLAKQAMDEYSSAKSWATYDTFFNGGLIADMVKYSKVDHAAEISNQLKSASTMMKKELSDVKMAFTCELDNMKDGTRFWDIAFDNVFTDWNVRNRLGENIDQLASYIGKVGQISSELQKERSTVEQKLNMLPRY